MTAVSLRLLDPVFKVSAICLHSESLSRLSHPSQSFIHLPRSSVKLIQSLPSHTTCPRSYVYRCYCRRRHHHHPSRSGFWCAAILPDDDLVLQYLHRCSWKLWSKGGRVIVWEKDSEMVVVSRESLIDCSLDVRSEVSISHFSAASKALPLFNDVHIPSNHCILIYYTFKVPLEFFLTKLHISAFNNTILPRFRLTKTHLKAQMNSYQYQKFLKKH